MSRRARQRHRLDLRRAESQFAAGRHRRPAGHADAACQSAAGPRSRRDGRAGHQMERAGRARRRNRTDPAPRVQGCDRCAERSGVRLAADRRAGAGDLSRGRRPRQTVARGAGRIPRDRGARRAAAEIEKARRSSSATTSRARAPRHAGGACRSDRRVGLVRRPARTTPRFRPAIRTIAHRCRAMRRRSAKRSTMRISSCCWAAHFSKTSGMRKVDIFRTARPWSRSRNRPSASPSTTASMQAWSAIWQRQPCRAERCGARRLNAGIQGGRATPQHGLGRAARP